MERGAREVAGHPDRPRADRRALAGDPVPARRLRPGGRDRHAASDQRRGRHPDQVAVPAFPPEARQEARLRRGPAQAARLRLKETDMTVTENNPILPSFGEIDTDRKLAIICSKGNLDM